MNAAADLASSLALPGIHMGKDWSDEFETGLDYQVMKGKDYKDFKRLNEVSESNSPSVMLLFEPGVNSVFLKTDKPIGKRLRKFIRSEVLPQINRTGEYSPDREIESSKPTPALTREDRKLAVAEAREARLSKGAEAKAMRRLAQLVEDSGQVDQLIITTHKIAAEECEIGRTFPALHMPAPDPWRTCTQIGNDLGISAIAVGKIARRLDVGGRNIPGMCRMVTSVSPHNAGKIIFPYIMSPEAERRIIEDFESSGKSNKQLENDSQLKLLTGG